jgi:hypothetical protein
VAEASVKVDMYFVTPNNELAALGEKVHRGLSNLSYDVGKLITVSSSELDKTLNQRSTKTKLMFALIHDGKKSEQDPDKIVRKLQQFADQQSGSLLVTVMTSSVEEPYNRSLDGAGAYFSANLRYKINYMLGGSNFNYTPVSSSPEAPLMIAGSHTAHFAGSKEMGYCPSVSAVVATTLTTGEHYFGSTRIQVTTEVQRQEPDGKLVRNTISGIADIGDMMRERFQAFKGQPTRLLYYHDSTNFDDEANNIMCQQIRAAYNEVYRETPKTLYLTYIVVNKNTKLEYNKRKAFEKNKTDPRLDFFTEDALAPKYRYYVISNDESMTENQLCVIVSFAS